ncbi:YdcF family protein [Streptomyces yaanensis]|uniref:YdcF family protein n=1 Tax=Streptomyces yaanensis TaxID=1142239 RepID=A0ABV7SJ35_9ACTN|nr:YdcF family protein [Streptomyces sp. CGMCC 4.7035]WNB97026.1 YdcF family protein [Streptomyces sp. CGMCC 4.7035]
MFSPATALNVLSSVLFVLFCAAVLRDPRRFGNAVLLGLSLFLLAAGTSAGTEPSVNDPAYMVWDLVTLVLFSLVAFGVVALAFFLLYNGVQMARKEGRRPANLLSLAAGLGILGTIGILAPGLSTGAGPWYWIAVVTFPVVAYVSFLFTCFLGYAYLYGRLRVRKDVDFVIVLGSGLIGGNRVPPLLAGRLERGRAVYEAQAARGNPPLLVTSGGQGPDEDLPEAHAMADYLTERGFPEEHLVREDRSTTTEENLRFSRAIMEELRPGHRCVVVTNNFHVFRAATLARLTGVDGHVVGSPTAAYFWPTATIREFAAVFLRHKVLNIGMCLLFAAVGVLSASL